MNGNIDQNLSQCHPVCTGKRTLNIKL